MALTSQMCWPLFLAVLVHQLIRVVSKRRRMKGAKYPPGPKGWPLLGNTLDLLPSKGYHVHIFRKWAEKYGHIVQFSIGRERQVILSDDKMVKELFLMRGKKYSDRYTTHAVAYMTMNQNPALRPRDDGWRRERTFINSAVSITSNQKYQSLMSNEATLTLHYLIQSPSSCDDQFVRYSYSVLTSALMGFTVSSASDPYILEHEGFRSRFMKGFRLDYFPNNVFPFLARMPTWLLPSLSTMETIRKEHIEQMWLLRRKIEKSVKDGSAGESIYKHFLLNRDEYAITDEELFYTYQAMVGAGTHNPHDALHTTLQLLAEYPKWQTKLQEEIDRVVGKDRMPNFEDVPSLPTLRAIVKEGFRYRGYAREAGVPRRLEEDDIYNGYFFEKGTVFHINFAAILTDKGTYPDGELFNPARWLDPSYPTYKEPLTLYPNCQNFHAFGYGIRSCPGADFGERTVVIMLSKLVWAFNIRRPLDHEVQETEKYYNYKIEPRDQDRVSLVQRAAEELM